MDPMKKKRLALRRRHLRVRRKIEGTPARPRLAVYRSLRHLYAQLIDDTTGRTLASTSTRDEDFPKDKRGCNRDGAAEAGRTIAEKAKKQSITSVVFDRGGRKYHGRVRAFAEGAREAGLKF